MIGQNITNSLLVAVILLAFAGCGRPKYVSDPSDEQVDAAIHLTANYLAARVQENGQFVYRVNMNPDERVRKSYNIEHHAAALGALIRYHRWCGDSELDGAMARAALFLSEQAVAPVPGVDGLLAVWSDPSINLTRHERQAKLGASIVGLTTLLDYEAVSPGFTSKDNLQALGRFIVYMQQKHGDVYTIYYPERDGRDYSKEDPRTVGMSLLPLAKLYALDGDEKWFQAALKPLRFMDRIRRHEFTRGGVDESALEAVMLFLEHLDPANLEKHGAFLRKFAYKMSEITTRHQLLATDFLSLHGGFSREGVTSTTGKRLLAIGKAIEYVPDYDPLLDDLRESMQLGVDYLLRAQVVDGEHAGAVPRATYVCDERFLYFETKNRLMTEVRIDTLQYVLSGWLAYREAFSGL